MRVVADITSSNARYEQNRLHYSRKFGETYYRGPGWSKAIDFTTRFGSSKRIAWTPLKKEVSHDKERKREREKETSLVTDYINSLSSNISCRENALIISAQEQIKITLQKCTIVSLNKLHIIGPEFLLNQ